MGRKKGLQQNVLKKKDRRKKKSIKARISKVSRKKVGVTNKKHVRVSKDIKTEIRKSADVIRRKVKELMRNKEKQEQIKQNDLTPLTKHLDDNIKHMTNSIQDLAKLRFDNVKDQKRGKRKTIFYRNKSDSSGSERDRMEKEDEEDKFHSTYDSNTEDERDHKNEEEEHDDGNDEENDTNVDKEINSQQNDSPLKTLAHWRGKAEADTYAHKALAQLDPDLREYINLIYHE